MNNIFSHWNVNTENLVMVLLLCILYLYATHFRYTKQFVYFITAIFIIIISIASPLHYLGENYLFSAHMLSHILLLLIAGPCIVAAIPEQNRFRNTVMYISRVIHKYPFMSWIIGVSIMWVWHIPAIFNHLTGMQGMQGDSLSMRVFMSLHMVSLLIAGIIFAWPLINPYKQFRISPLNSVLYLSSACVFCSLLGLLITFAPAGTFTGYISGYDSNGILSFIRNQWKISAEEDQQIGGLIMWVPCCFIYLSASMILLVKWFEKKEVNIKIHY